MTARIHSLLSPFAVRAHRERRGTTHHRSSQPATVSLDRVLSLLDSVRVPSVVSAAVDAERGGVRVELEAPHRVGDQDRIGADIGALLLAEPGVRSVSIAFLSLDIAGGWVDAHN